MGALSVLSEVSICESPWSVAEVRPVVVSLARSPFLVYVVVASGLLEFNFKGVCCEVVFLIKTGHDILSENVIIFVLSWGNPVVPFYSLVLVQLGVV
jgi:hypothetical protein